MTTANQANFARMIGYSRASVTQFKNAGRIVMTPDGKLVDVEASIARMKATADPGRKDVADRHQASRASAQKGAVVSRDVDISSVVDSDVDNDQGGRAQAKSLLMEYENKILKLEMAMRRGLCFERSAVKKEAVSIGAMLRAGIERVIDQTAPRLAAESDETARKLILEREVSRLRWVIKRELPRSLRRMKEATTARKENT